MRIPTFISNIFLWLPLCLYPVDANAWGLVTHVYFAHSLLWAMPLLDPRLQRVIKKFPELVMAGACIPDLAVVSRQYHKPICGKKAFNYWLRHIPMKKLR